MVKSMAPCLPQASGQAAVYLEATSWKHRNESDNGNDKASWSVGGSVNCMCVHAYSNAYMHAELKMSVVRIWVRPERGGQRHQMAPDGHETQQLVQRRCTAAITYLVSKQVSVSLVALVVTALYLPFCIISAFCHGVIHVTTITCTMQCTTWRVVRGLVPCNPCSLTLQTIDEAHASGAGSKNVAIILLLDQERILT